MIKFVVRVVATGFCLSLGSALFKKVQDQLGLGEDKDKDKDKATKDSDKVNAQDGVSDPGLSTV
jgi:hypothetical protein